MRLTTILLLAALAVCGFVVFSNKFVFASQIEVAGKLPVPPKFQLSILCDRNQYFLGENVNLHFVVENTGKSPFKLETGGDYRGAPRHIRFKVKATGEDGSICADPYPNPFCEGGLGGESCLKPGEKHADSLPLLRYCRIEKPGTYRISVSHDLGWQIRADKLPAAETSITFLPPNADQAKAVVDKLLKGGTESDFTTLEYPIYLPVLKDSIKQALNSSNQTKTTLKEVPEEQALEKDQREKQQARQSRQLADAKKIETDISNLLTGTGSIPTPEATLALIELAGSKSEPVSRQAAQHLSMRLPDPQWEGRLSGRSPFENPMIPERKRLVKLTWRPEFSEPVLNLARQFLSRKDKTDVQIGSFMIECLGNKACAAMLIAPLDQAIAGAKNLKPELCYPRPRGALAELMRAATILVQNNADIPGHPKTPGESALFLTAIGQRKDFRPADWQSTYLLLARSDFPYVRELCALNLPLPAEVPLVKLLPQLLADPDVDVKIAACQLALKQPDVSLKTQLLDIVRKSQDTWLFHGATNAVSKVGGYFEALEIMASRLGEPGKMETQDTSYEMLSGLIDGCIDSSSSCGYGFQKQVSCSEAAALRPKWQKFLHEQQALLKSGKKFAPGDHRLTADLFPVDFQFNLPDGKVWPTRNKK